MASDTLPVRAVALALPCTVHVQVLGLKRDVAQAGVVVVEEVQP
jgi:hypothetical protein